MIRFSDWVLEHSIETEYTPYDLVEEQLVAQMDVCTTMMECYAKQCDMAMIYMEAEGSDEEGSDNKPKSEEGKKWYQKAADVAKKGAATVGRFFQALWMWMRQTVEKAVAFATSKRIDMIIKRIDKLDADKKAKLKFKIPEYINTEIMKRTENLGDATHEYINRAKALAEISKGGETAYDIPGLISDFNSIYADVEKGYKISYKEGRNAAYDKKKLKEGSATSDRDAEEFKKLLTEFKDSCNSAKIKEAMKLLKRKDLMKKIVEDLGEGAEKKDVKDAKGDVKDCYAAFTKAGNMIRFALNKYVVATVAELSRCIKQAFKDIEKNADEGEKEAVAKEAVAAEAEEAKEIDDIYGDDESLDESWMDIYTGPGRRPPSPGAENSELGSVASIPQSDTQRIGRNAGNRPGDDRYAADDERNGRLGYADYQNQPGSSSEKNPGGVKLRQERGRGAQNLVGPDDAYSYEGK